MQILVLGGTGFIGPPAVRRLVEAGHEVTLFHRGKTDAPLPEEVRHILGEREKLDESAPALRQLAPEVVIDLNAYTQRDGEALVALFTGVAHRLVVISSGDVYRAYDRFRRKDPGPPDPTPLTEESPLRDRLFPYAETPPTLEEEPRTYEKILMERAATSAPDALPATVLRLPMVYGPGDYQHRCFGYLKQMDDGRPVILLPEDMARWHGLRGYVEDVGAAIALCTLEERAARRAYHVADHEALTEAEWVSRIARAAGWNGKVVTLPNEKLPAHLRHPYDATQDWSLDTTRLRRELRYSEPTPADVAMERTVAWERAHPPQTWDPARFDYAAEDTLIGTLTDV